MANVEINWTVPGKSNADLLLSFDPNAVDANGNVVVDGASGTYQVLNPDGSVARTDQVTGLIAPNSYIFAPDDQVNVSGRNPIVDTAGVGVIINNAADADNIGPNNTPQIVFSTDIFGDYRELQKGDATGVSIQQIDDGTPGGPTGGTPGGPTGGPTGNPPEVFVFHPDPTLANIAHVLGTPRGLEAISQVSSEFSSLAQFIAHSHPSADGSSTIIHLPSENQNIVLKNLTEGEIRTDIKFLRHLLF